MTIRHGASAAFGVVILIGAAAFVGFRVAKRGSERQQRTEMSRADDGSAASTARDVAALMAVYAAAAPARPPSVPGESPQGPSPAPEPPAAPPVSNVELHKRLEGAFLREDSDAQWIAKVKGPAEAKLRELLPAGSGMRAIECRTSLCRIETTHRDFETFVHFAEAAFTDPSRRLWNGASTSVPLTDNPADGIFVTYLAREGEPLVMDSE